MIIKNVKVIGGELDQVEIAKYVEYLEDKHGKLAELTIKLDGEYVELTSVESAVPFERIRRITGYLVGTTDRWNNAKVSEEKDRVKHDLKGVR